MRAVLSAASVLVLAAGASAAPFQVLGYQAGAGVPGIRGPGFFTNGALGFFQSGDAGANDFGSVALAPGITLGAQLDTHLTVDDFGPSALTGSPAAYADYSGPGYNGTDSPPTQVLSDPTGQAGTSNIVAGSGSFIGGAGTLGSIGAGIGISPQPFRSGFFPDFAAGGRSNIDGVFIGRLTVEGGANVSGGAIVSLKNEAGLTDPTAPTHEGELLIGGPAVQIGAQSYQLVAVLVAQSQNLSEGGFFGRTFASADTFDLWVIVPTPGAAALFGLGGLAALRRRRA